MPIDKPKRKATIIQEKEFKEMINNVYDPMHKALFCLLFGTGARVSEIVRKLTPADIELDSEGYLKAQIITLKYRRNPLRTVYINPRPKNEPDRSWLIEPIVAWKEQCPFEFLFPISRERAWQLTTKYFGTKTHSFRHTDASRSAKKGLNNWEMMQRYGWKDIGSSTHYIILYGEESKKKL